MDKLKMQSENLVEENVEKIATLFPNCITEGKNEKGETVKLVDFDLLKQELSKDIVEGNDERYVLNWAGKKQAILTANSPIAKTLRPCKEESVDFENTKNLYIEGDNLDVLKLLRETYLNKVKMIYIDPPYNTGNDFVYNDDFASSAEEYFENSKSFDEQGNRLFQNNESNGRFHSDWLSMIYSRLRVAKDLLTEDGVIFISIDDNEQSNLKKVCDEIFGINNTEEMIWHKVDNDSGKLKITYRFRCEHEYIIICYKNKEIIKFNKFLQDRNYKNKYTNPDNDPRGEYKQGIISDTEEKSSINSPNFYTVITPSGKEFKRRWRVSKEEFNKLRNDNRIYFGKDGNAVPSLKVFVNEQGYATPISILQNFGTAKIAGSNLEKILGDRRIFSYPKPVNLLKHLINIVSNKNDTILDFFSGSATTAHAVMQLNAEDSGNRKFIMVQLPENTDEKSEAYKAGYKNICEIGKERIRRAGQKILEFLEHSGYNYRKLQSDGKPYEINSIENGKVHTTTGIATGMYDSPTDVQMENNKIIKDTDIGFRCLKLDSSCMKDIYYNPSELTQGLLFGLEDNIKEDRTPEDLLFQVMLDMGVLLSSEIKTIDIKGKKVFNVNDGNLVCCFDQNLTDEVVTEIAKMKPLYAVFRDSSMATDSVAVNFDQIFETYSTTTTRKVI